MSDFNFNFKVGDKVYYPAGSTQIYTLDSYDDARYPLAIVEEPSFTASFNHQGREWARYQLSSIFHATEENRRKLSELHGVDFEEPHKPKTPKDVIQAMLDSGWDTVPVIYLEDGKKCLDYANKTYLSMSAKPFNPKTGKIIIDYLNGQEIYAD